MPEMTESAALSLWEAIERSDAKMAALIPDVKAALDVMHAGWVRLKKLGWRDGIYCPKDGSAFELIEFGSTGIFVGHYMGEWPNGCVWVHDADGDMSPTKPQGIMWRPLQSKEKSDVE